MKKSCGRCGKIHRRGECEAKAPPKKPTDAALFHGSNAWAKARDAARIRDMGMCQVCLRGMYEPARIYNTRRLEVHHIAPLSADYDRRLDADNLITLCERHHEMADKGKIPAETLARIVRERSAGGR
jgi:5-methylcytosine-specific restriction endonuclease McrA